MSRISQASHHLLRQSRRSPQIVADRSVDHSAAETCVLLIAVGTLVQSRLRSLRWERYDRDFCLFRTSREYLMPARHPCPNCGNLRDGPHENCPKCRYPNHARVAETPKSVLKLEHPPFQFHIRTLVVVTALAAVVCAVTKHWGIEGLWLGLRIVALLFPIVEFFYYFWINLRSNNYHAIDEYEDKFS